MVTISIITLLVALTVNPSTPAEFVEVSDLPAPVEAVEPVPQPQETASEAAEPPQEAEYAEEWYWEPSYEETGYYEPAYYAEPEWTAPYDATDGISAAEFQWMGVVDDGEHTYTWYSENVLPGGGLDDLNANGRHSEDGFVKDADGFIAVASCDYEKGTVIETPFGAAKVYDTGYLAPGQIDVYTSF